MQLTVFGASGRTGRHVVDQALQAGDQVSSVVRSAARYADLRPPHPSLTVVEQPSLDAAAIPALADALTGADAVISAIGPTQRNSAPVAAPAIRTILAAMGQAGVSRIAVISAAPVAAEIPAEDSWITRRIAFPLISRIFRQVYDDLREMERELSASASAWTSVRPPRLTDGRLTGHYRTVTGANVPHGSLLSRQDLAHFLLRAVSDESLVRQAVGIAY